MATLLFWQRARKYLQGSCIAMEKGTAPGRRSQGTWSRIAGVLALGGVAAALIVGAEGPYDRATWQADYASLKASLAQHYANLDWAVSHRGLDLVAIDLAVTQELASARSNGEARRVLESFIDRFADPHLRFVRRRAATEAMDGQAEGPSQVQSCSDAGFESGSKDGELALEELDGWKDLPSELFKAGFAGEIGVIRIASFGENQYASACRQLFAGPQSPRQLQLAVREQLQAELVRLVAALEDAGIRILVVDITGNGGGSEWSSQAASLFTAQEMTRAAPRLASPQCDRSGIWIGENVCPVLEPANAPVNLVGVGAWRGPLAILIDRNTASAAEDFAAWLHGNGAASLIGEKTAGAGCGYVDGGGLIRLTAGDHDVMAPNCARFLASGLNEIEGLEPDVYVSMSGPVAERANAIRAALAGIGHEDRN